MYFLTNFFLTSLVSTYMCVYIYIKRSEKKYFQKKKFPYIYIYISEKQFCQITRGHVDSESSKHMYIYIDSYE